jgi:hypothetical protein
MIFGEGKNIFIEDYISGDIGPSCGEIKALKTFVPVAISQEHTLLRVKFQLVRVIGPEMGPTSATKNAQG